MLCARAIPAGPPGPRADIPARLRRAMRAVLVTVTVASGLSCSDAATGPEPPGSVVASRGALSLEPLDTVRVQATVTRADGSLSPAAVLTWRSLDTTIARVDASGLVTAVPYAGPQVRTTVVEVSSPGALPDSVRTEVRPWPVRRVRIALDTVTVSPRDSATVAVATENERGLPLAEREVVWFSSDTAALQALPGGKLRAWPYTGPLRRSVVASAWSEGRADSIVVVIPPLAVAVIETQRDSVTLQPGALDTIRVVARSAGGDVLQAPPLRWRTTDSTIVRTNAEGILTASFYAGAAIRTARVIVEGGPAADTVAVRVTPLSVARIVLRPDSGRVVAGASLLLDAQALDAGGVVLEQRPVAWHSSDTTVATVSASGQVSAQPYGGTATRSVHIIASAGPAADTLPLDVTPHPVRWVAATPEALSLLPLDSATLVPTLLAADLTELRDRPVTYESRDGAVAAVTAAGRVMAADHRGPQVRTTQVLVRSGEAVDTVPVEVRPLAVARVVATPATVALAPPDTVALALQLEAADGRVLTGRTTLWQSTDTTVVRVTSEGRAIGAAYGGTATRTAEIVIYSEGVADTVAVTVTPLPPASVALTPDSASIIPGQQRSFAATVRAAGGETLTGRTLTWTSIDTTIARVNADGVVTATFYVGGAERVAGIVAATGAVADTAPVRVRPLAVAQATVFPDTQTLTPNRTAQLDVVLRDSAGTFLTGRTVTWASLDTAFASVSATGLVRTRRAGTARITASAGTGLDTVSVTIVFPARALRLTPSLATVWIGRSQALVLEIRDSAGTLLTDRFAEWTSSNPAVASVSPAGVVSGVSQGTAVITATVEGLVATMTVDVFPEPSAAITITFDDAWRGVLQLAAPLFDTLRLRANVGWITNVDWSGVMTPPELRQLQDRGWSILSHTMTHARLTSLTPDSAAAEISRSRARIDSLGFDPRVFIVPYLDYSPAVLAASAAAGYQYTRCCAQDVWSPDTLVAWPIAPAARHRLTGVDVTNYDGQTTSYNFRTAAGRTALRTLLQQVVAQGKFVDVFFHDIVPDDVADLRLTLQILAEFRPYLMTYAALP